MLRMTLLSMSDAFKVLIVWFHLVPVIQKFVLRATSVGWHCSHCSQPSMMKLWFCHWSGTKLDLVQRALQIWCENSLDPPLIWRVQAKDSTSKWPWRAGSRASEEIPYTRFDLQEFFDPDMEAPTDLLRSYQLSLLCRCESDKSFSHSQATWWHGCRDDVKASKWSTFPATCFILVFKCNASSRYHHPKNRPVACHLYPWW